MNVVYVTHNYIESDSASCQKQWPAWTSVHAYVSPTCKFKMWAV